MPKVLFLFNVIDFVKSILSTSFKSNRFNRLNILKAFIKSCRSNDNNNKVKAF